MRPVRPGDRGRAVEDIQRRLLMLGHDLGRTGIDGVFLGATTDAVRTFQSGLGLVEDGVVDEQTWSALVDATFRLGDRTLYLRMPHFHGEDVRVLQNALNALGFSCGRADGIFGAYTESGVRDFQRNSGLPGDGIVGPETVRALNALRHVWDGKDSTPHSAARTGPARPGRILAAVPLYVGSRDEVGRSVAERIVNLALATNEAARTKRQPVEGRVPDGGYSVVVSATGTPTAEAGCPIVRGRPLDTLASRVVTALSSPAGCRELLIDLEGEDLGDAREEQSLAVGLLDALCDAFDRLGSAW